MADDKKIIDVKSQYVAVITQIFQSGEFMDYQDVARFAFAYALKHSLYENSDDSLVSDGKGMSWHSGNIDDKDILTTLVKSMFPEEEHPYRFIEKMINLGLKEIGEKLGDKIFTISDWI